MRLNSFLLLGLLIGAALVHARDEETADENEAEQGVDEEEQSTTKPPKRVTKKPKMKDPEQPECRTETINGRSAYLCERTVDGMKNRFGVQFDRTGALLCGEFENNELNGYGYRLFHQDESAPRMECGNYVEGFLEGPAEVYFFVTKGIEIANRTRSQRQGIGLRYDLPTDTMDRFWYRNDQCKSRLTFNTDGEEIYRNPYTCKLNK